MINRVNLTRQGVRGGAAPGNGNRSIAITRESPRQRMAHSTQLTLFVTFLLLAAGIAAYA